MATIQVRDISDEAYETIKRRAKAAGQSIQAYMKAQIEELATQPTDEELLARAQDTARRLKVRIDPEQLRADIDAGRH